MGDCVSVDFWPTSLCRSVGRAFPVLWVLFPTGCSCGTYVRPGTPSGRDLYFAGNLKSGSQIIVVQQSPQTIVIQSANPQVVYVPVYNPTVVYGYPHVTPGYSTAAVVTTGVIAFGVGVAVGVAMSGGHYGWGIATGTVAGTEPLQWCIAAARITETPPGAAATMAPTVQVA